MAVRRGSCASALLCRRQLPQAAPRPAASICAASTASPAPTTSFSKHASTRSTRSCAAPADRRRPKRASVLGATALWWQILLDPESRALDDEFSDRRRSRDREHRGMDRAGAGRCRGVVLPRRRLRGAGPVAGAARREARQPRATARRSRSRWSARSRSTPTSRMRYFGIGMYKVLRRRRAGGGKDPALPAAAAGRRSRRKGSTQMLRARTRGRLLQGEADYQLHVIYLWYERQTPRALQLLRVAARPLPRQPALPRADGGDPGRLSARRHRQPGDVALAARRRARTARATRPALSEVQARLGIAEQLEVLHQTDDAIEMLQAVIALQPDGAVWVAAARATCGWVRRTTGWASAPRPSTPTGRRRAAPCARSASTSRGQTRRAPAARARSAARARRIACRSRDGGGSSTTICRAPQRRSRPRSRSTRPIRSRATASAACSRRGRTMRRRCAQFEHADPQRAHVPGADPRQRLSRSGARCSSALGHAARRRSPTTASPRHSSAPPPTRTPPPRVRSPTGAVASSLVRPHRLSGRVTAAMARPSDAIASRPLNHDRRDHDRATRRQIDASRRLQSRSRTVDPRKFGVRFFDISCTLCLTVIFLIHNLHLV